jgi:hypothetical protein
MTNEKNLQELSDTIRLIRNLSLFLNFLCIIQMLLAAFLPDMLTPLLRIWLVVIMGGSYLAIITGLFMARSDPKTTLFFVVVSFFLSGLVFGISMVVILSTKKL